MADVFDIMLNESFDLIIEKGDFKVDESSLQHQQILLLADKGQIKQEPIIGVGIDTYLNDEASASDIKRVIQEQFEIDGMTIDRLSIPNYDQMEINAHYGTQDGTDTR